MSAFLSTLSPEMFSCIIDGGGYESRPEFIKEAVRKRLEEIKALAK
jgi:metal-responsive CopG/Arc/MetJ family transcriptional regulator